MMTDACTMGKEYVMNVDAMRVRICERSEVMTWRVFRLLKQERAMPL